MSLHQLQADMMAAFYRSKDASAYVEANETLTAQDRIDIYAGSVLGTMSQALRDIYPVVCALLGDEFFEALAQRYVKNHPSKSYSLDHYGEPFAEFMSIMPPIEPVAYTVEVAKLEWAYHSVFHEKDVSETAMDQLAQVPAEAYGDVVFRLNPGLRLLDLKAPGIALWRAHQPEASSDDLSQIDINEQDGPLVVWRRSYDIHMLPLTQARFDFLRLIQEEKKFGTICEEWLSIHSESDLNAILLESIQSQWIVDFTI